jgi:asparagine N-glycosylation enzyme membrane subunit Stt3
MFAGRREWVVVVAIVVVAFVVRVSWIAYADFEPTINDDAGRYDFLGRSLAEGGGYTNPNGNTTMFWPPGYPFWLTNIYKAWPQAEFGDHQVTAGLIANAMLSAATVALVYAIARRPFGRTAATAAALIYALFPSMIFFANVTLTETLFTFLLMLSLWLFIEAEHRRVWWMLAAAAAIAGYASLVRGLALLLPIVLAPFWWRATGDARWVAVRVVVVGMLIAAMVAPWTMRNYVESDALVLVSSNAGVDFYIGHSDGADGRGRIVDELVFRYPELPPAEAEAQVNRDGFREGIEWALRHPVDEVELAFRKTFFLWYRDDEGLRWNDGHGESEIMPAGVRDAMIVLSNVYYWAVMAAAAAGAVILLRRYRDQPVTWMLLSLVAYWTLAHIAFFGDPRFHAPVVPVVSVFAGVAVGAVIAMRGADRSEDLSLRSSRRADRSEEGIVP